MISEIRKIELAHEVLNTVGNRGISIKDRLSILNLATKALKGKEQVYNRRKKT